MTSGTGQIDGFEQALTADAYQSAWRYAWRLAGNREDAEDLLQESLVSALKAFGQLRDPGSFKSWLLAIVRRQHLVHLRRRHSGIAALTGRLGDAEETVPDYRAVDDGDPLTEQLALALERLPAAQRELVALFYFEGLSLRETARVLGTTPNAVTQRLHRARTALRGIVAGGEQLPVTACHTRGDL